MFTFLRRPEELLCSLYHWSKENNIQLSASPAPKNLEQIFEYAVNNKDFERLWKLPNYIHLLDYVAEFNEEKQEYEKDTITVREYLFDKRYEDMAQHYKQRTENIFATA